MRLVGYGYAVGPYEFTCETCGAKPAHMCQGGRGWPKRNVQPHAPRLKQWEAKQSLPPRKVEKP
jgi:hypothetical protein